MLNDCHMNLISSLTEFVKILLTKKKKKKKKS